VIDLLIPAAPKDYVKIPHIIAAASRNVPEIERVCLVTPERLDYVEIGGLRVNCFTDADILPGWYDRSTVGWRPNWISQQFIKLTQRVTDTEYWLTIDADTFFNRRVEVFTQDGKPILYTGADQLYEPYFSFNQELLRIGRSRNESFISECTLYSRKVVNDMLNYLGGRGEFIRKSIEIINTSKGHPAESEIYAAFVLKYYPDLYEIRRLATFINGRYGEGEYSENDVIKKIVEYAEGPFQTFSLHSWSETWN
jgi:hypothetical protein